MVADDTVFQVYVAKVDLGYCICCNNNIRMLQTYVSSVLDVSDVCFKCVYLDVAYVAMALPICFKRMFQVVHIFRTYVVSVLSGCCKNRFGSCICCYTYTHMFHLDVSK